MDSRTLIADTRWLDAGGHGHYDGTMPWPENSLTDNEEIIASFHPHWKLLAIPVLVGVLVLAVFIAIESWIDWGFWIRFVIAVVILAWFVARPVVEWWFTRYVLTTERLITRRGLIAQSGIEIPLDGITNVNFSQTVFERVLGAGDLLVESAGETGQSSFSNIPRPDRFQSILYKAREARTIALGSGGGEGRRRQPGAEADLIRKLAELRDEGLISEAEYEQKRAQILRDI